MIRKLESASIATRVALAVAAVLALAVATMVPFAVQRAGAIVRATEADGLAALYDGVEHAIAAESARAEALAAMIAALPQSGEALAKG